MWDPHIACERVCTIVRTIFSTRSKLGTKSFGDYYGDKNQGKTYRAFLVLS